MDSLFSPTSQSFSLIPRFSYSSPSSSTSSPAAHHLSLSRIQSIRRQFLGAGSHRLGARARRRCRRRPQLDANRAPELRLVASLMPLPIVAVVVAMTVSAAAVYSNFRHLKKKKGFDEVSSPTGIKDDQEGRDAGEKSIYSPTNAEQLHVENLKESNLLLMEVADGTPKDTDDGLKQSYQQSTSTPEDTHNIELHDTTLTDIGAIASTLSEKSEQIGLFSLEESPELDVVGPSTETLEPVNSEIENDLDLLSPASMVEISNAASALADTASLKGTSNEEINHENGEEVLQATVFTASGREELHSFYDGMSSDYHEIELVTSTLSSRASLSEGNHTPVVTKVSEPKNFPEDHSPSAGGRINRGKYSRKGRIPRSDTSGSSSRYGHQKFSEVPEIYNLLVNGEHKVSSYMSSYNSLLRRGRLSECIELLEDMNRKDILDTNKIYHAKFFDLCRGRKSVKEAFRFTKLIANPTLSTFNMLMSVCSTAQDSEGAFEVWRMVQEAGFRADCKLYTTLISTCAKSGKVDTMFEVFHEMVNSGIEPNVHTYGALIDGCARAGQIAKAFGAYGILRSKNVKPDRVVFNALITACGQSGAAERAFDVLAEMRAEAHPIEPDHITVGALIQACTGAGQVDRVRGVYEMMDKYNIRGTPELYTIAVNSCSQTGDWEFACSIYDDMKKKDVIPDEMFFSALIDVAGHAGNLDAAFEVIQDARAQGMNPGIIAYSSLMGACSNTRNWEKALELFEQIKAMKLNPTVPTLNALITALCDADQMHKALNILSEMKNLGLCPNGVTYSILLAASEKNDDLEAGLTLYSQVKANGIPISVTMCRPLIRMCSRRYENASVLGEPVFSLKSGRPQIDSKWTSIALMVYREMIGAGLIPSMGILAQVLGCLQLPQDLLLKKRLTETLVINTRTSKTGNLLSLVDGFGEYDPRAFSLFEEGASLGIVPGASFKESPIFIDATSMSTQIAEVYILTVLKGLKHRLAAGAKLPSITISLPVETTEILRPKGDKAINVSGRVSQAVGALFRRLRLPYQGGESHGKIRISGLAVKRWLQPKLVPAFTGKQAQLGLSQLGLASGILYQQRNIRTGNLSLD